jgi:hypothetical protein
VLTAEEVSARLRPLFAALCEQGFTSAGMSSPARDPAGSTLAPQRPIAAAPVAQESLARECAAAGIDVAAVTKCSADLSRVFTPRQAHDVVLAIYASQAIHDAENGNLHRAHVLLGDTIAEILATPNEELATTLFHIEGVFLDVPDESVLRALGGHLERYLQVRNEQLVLGGEHVAVLMAGGLEQAAAPRRDRLLADVRLVALPLVDLAIARGETYGWQMPAAVSEARDRLQKNVAALADGHVNDAAFRTEVEWRSVEAERAAVTAAARAHAAVFLAGRPLRYDGEKQRLQPVGTESLVADDQLAAVARWITDAAAADPAGDGSLHMLMALHWLAADRPDRAWESLVAGAATLLEAGKAGATNAKGDATAVAATLCRQLNGYRLLAASKLLPAASLAEPGGMAGGVMPAEIGIFLASWRNAWVAAGLPRSPADAILADFARTSAQGPPPPPAAMAIPPVVGRYFFFDYRFLGDGVPEVLVAKAAAEELTHTAKQPELATTERFLDFLRAFGMPRDFSPGFPGRLQPGSGPLKAR